MLLLSASQKIRRSTIIDFPLFINDNLVGGALNEQFN